MIDKDNPRHEKLRAALKALRKSKGVTQLELAERLGKPQSHISKIESGDRNVDVIQLLDILNAIGMNSENVILELFRKISGDNS